MHKLPVTLRTTNDEKILNYKANRDLLKNLDIEVTVDVDEYETFYIDAPQNMISPSSVKAASYVQYVTADDIAYARAHGLRGMEIFRLAVERELANRLRQ